MEYLSLFVKFELYSIVSLLNKSHVIRKYKINQLSEENQGKLNKNIINQNHVGLYLGQ